MLRFLCKCKWQTLTKSKQTCPNLQNLQFLKSICRDTRSITTSTIDPHHSFTVSHLKNSCGLSGKSLISASKEVHFESSKRPNPVLKLFQNFGFSQTQVEGIISRFPRILVASVEKTLKPKLDFFLSMGISKADLMHMFTADPFLLKRSLKKQLIPSFDLLKALVGGEQKAVAAIKHYPTVLRYDIPKCLAPNVLLLRSIGVPQSRISKMICGYTKVIAVQPDRFSKAVSTVKEMGFAPSSSHFVHAVSAMAFVRESTWDGKFDIYRSLGFSNDEVHSLFKKQPICMSFSEEKIRGKVEFYVSKLCWSPSRLSTSPNVLLYSLEKRIIPRCSVLQALALRNKIDRSTMVTSILVMTEKDFLRKYVTKYREEVPEVLDAHKGRLKFDEYNFDLVGAEEDVAL